MYIKIKKFQTNEFGEINKDILPEVSYENIDVPNVKELIKFEKMLCNHDGKHMTVEYSKVDGKVSGLRIVGKCREYITIIK